jgi:hypothetical protein
LMSLPTASSTLQQSRRLPAPVTAVAVQLVDEREIAATEPVPFGTIHPPAMLLEENERL